MKIWVCVCGCKWGAVVDGGGCFDFVDDVLVLLL